MHHGLDDLSTVSGRFLDGEGTYSCEDFAVAIAVKPSWHSEVASSSGVMVVVGAAMKVENSMQSIAASANMRGSGTASVRWPW